MGLKTVQNSSFRGLLVWPSVLSLALSRKNLGLLRQSFLPSFVAKKIRVCHDKVLSLALSRQNLGLSHKSYVFCIVATKSGFVMTNFCF